MEIYNQLYPGIENRRYQMQSVVKDSRPLRFRNIEEFNESWEVPAIDSWHSRFF